MEPVDPGDLADRAWCVEDHSEAYRTPRSTVHEKKTFDVVKYTDLSNMGLLLWPSEEDILVKFP